MTTIPKVLIVDDRPENLLALEVALRPLRCEVVRASSGKEALEVLRQTKVAAILVDVQMPIMDGFELSKRIRENPDTAVTPILLVSAFNIDNENIEKAYESGASALLSKPINTKVLEGKVRYFLTLFEKIESNNLKNILARKIAEDEKVQLIESSLDAVIGASADETIIYWNACAVTTFGWTKDEAIGRKMAELIIPERLRSAHRRGMSRFLETGESRILNQRIEVPAIRKSGEEFQVELTVTSVKSPEGSYRFYSFVRDISERVRGRKAIEQIKDLSHRFSRSAKATDLGIWYCDLPLNIVNMSDETRNHLCLPLKGEITIEDFYTHVHPDDRERTRAAVNSAIEKQIPYNIIYRTLDPKNPVEIKSIRAIGWTDYDADKKPVRFDGITLDVTPIVRVSEELQKAKEAAERANNLKSFFLASMSHEIRTPLGAMLGFAELLRDPTLSIAERSNYLDVLTRNGESLAIIINDILDLSKVEAGKIVLEYKSVSIKSLLNEVMALMNVKAKEKKLALDFVIGPDCQDEVVTDSLRVRQVLLNLVNNAIKFTPFGHVRILASSVTTGQNRCLSFDVVDSGIGVAPSERDRIFEAFAQAEESTTRRFGGTGLGLALSRRLATELGGSLVLASSIEGKGSTFRFTIRDETEKVEALKAPDKAAAITNLGPHSLDGIRVLVIDDSPDNQLLIYQYLKRYGAVMDTADNGIVGQKMALSGSFDIVLMDIQMPEMDGYTATEQLRARGFTKPIVALTAHAMSEVRDRCMKVGCTAHLTKPIDSRELISTVYNLTR